MKGRSFKRENNQNFRWVRGWMITLICRSRLTQWCSLQITSIISKNLLSDLTLLFFVKMGQISWEDRREGIALSSVFTLILDLNGWFSCATGCTWNNMKHGVTNVQILANINAQSSNHRLKCISKKTPHFYRGVKRYRLCEVNCLNIIEDYLLLKLQRNSGISPTV